MRECVGRIYLGLSIVLLVSFLSLFLFNSKAQALFYCVGCPDGTNITCDGGAACPSFCNDGNAPNFFNCPTIDEALDCIAENTDMDAMILVAQGTHTGPGSTDVIDNTAMGADQSIQILGGFVPPTCALRSLNPNNTTVERPFDDRVFFIENTTSDNFSVRLEGMTITGGRTDGTTPDCPSGGALDDKNGAGVCATTTGSGDLDFTSFLNKYIDNITTNAGSGGGGLGVIAGGGGNITATIMDDAYTGNQAETFGGGMWFATDDTVFLDVSIDNATIGGSSVFPVEGNDAAIGGGFSIFSTGGRIDVSNQGNTISNNSASAGSGGGIDILQSCGTCSPVTVSIDLDTITLNTASTGGGGVDIDAITTNSIINVSINKTIIGSNSATSSPGGGVRVQGNGEVNLFPVVNSCIFKNKTLSLLGGGGVAAVTSGNSADFDIKFVNNTIADNEANGATAVGGGILASSLGNTGVINWTLPNDLIFSNNAVGDGNEVALANTGANATLALRFTLTRLAAPGDLLGVNLGVIPATGFVNLLENVINGNPQYIDPPSDNYRIPDTSPANGAGTSSATGTIAGNEAQPPADDFDGKPRPLPPSIGAYEPGPTPTPTPTATATATPIPTPTATPILTPTATPTVAPTVTATPTAFPTLTPPPTTPTLPPTTTPTIIPTPPNIVTIPNARNGALVTLISPLGTKLTDVDAFRTLQGCPDGFNGQFLNFPIGSFEFVVGGLQRGGSTTVEIILPPGTRINSFFKFGPEPDNPEPHCYEFLFDGFTGAEILSDRVVLHFIDGERGDGDLVPNGTIVEPGGPAFLSDEPLNGGGGCALAQTVQSGSALLNLVLPILPALAFGLRILRRKTLKG